MFKTTSERARKQNASVKSGNGVDDQACIRSPRDLLQRMLESQSGDWEIVAKDGTVFKFHTAVLAEQVPYFRKMFSSKDSIECKNKRVDISTRELKLCAGAVEGLLRYIYYHDTTVMDESFRITCSLICAGHYYDIPKLVKAANGKIENKMNSKMLNWFDVEGLWELYQKVWLWEESHPSKQNLVSNIVNVLRQICESGTERPEAFLTITNDNKALRDLILALVKFPKPLRVRAEEKESTEFCHPLFPSRYQ